MLEKHFSFWFQLEKPNQKHKLNKTKGARNKKKLLHFVHPLMRQYMDSWGEPLGSKPLGPLVRKALQERLFLL